MLRAGILAEMISPLAKSKAFVWDNPDTQLMGDLLGKLGAGAAGEEHHLLLAGRLEPGHSTVSSDVFTGREKPSTECEEPSQLGVRVRIYARCALITVRRVRRTCFRSGFALRLPGGRLRRLRGRASGTLAGHPTLDIPLLATGHGLVNRVRPW